MGNWKKTRLVPIAVAAVVLIGTATDFDMSTTQNEDAFMDALKGNASGAVTYNLSSDASRSVSGAGQTVLERLGKLAEIIPDKNEVLALMSLDGTGTEGVLPANVGDSQNTDPAGDDANGIGDSQNTDPAGDGTNGVGDSQNTDPAGDGANGVGDSQNADPAGDGANGVGDSQNTDPAGDGANGVGDSQNADSAGNDANGVGDSQNEDLAGNGVDGIEGNESASQEGSDDNLYMTEESKEQEGPAPEIYVQGVTHSSVADVQQRLMDLGFMDYSEPTMYYGPVTMEAVKLFQRQNDLAQDGILGPATWEMLFAEDAKYYLAKAGMDGDDIRRIQQRLYEMGYLAKAEHVTGHFGDVTEAAVKQMQQNNGLAADGKVGHDTMEMLYSEEAKANLLSYGDKSDVVLSCQERLKELGYLTTKPDGQYGNDTVAAVKQFQSRNDLVVDGYLGPTTMVVLHSKSATPNGLVIGETGDTVKRVQELLSRYGYMSSSNCTGYFGEITEAAVKEFQRKNGLTADGNVGMRTMAKLTDGNAVKANGSSSGSSNSSSSSSSNSSSSSGSSGNKGSGTTSSSSTVTTGSASVSALLKVAKSKLGAPYVYGAKGPNAFDCSGYVYWCLNQVGIKQSYTTSYGWRTIGKYQKITSFSSIKAGDIVVVKGHVGIAAGNGMVYDASSGSGKIVYRSLGDWWKRNFICAWRIF